MPLTDRVFPDGTCLIIEPIAATKAAAIGFWFKKGSRDEIEGQYGITHFLEHMLFKGTPDLSARDIARFFDRIGGYVNAFTERELLCVFCVVPARHARASLETLCQMIWQSELRDEEIERERSVITSEILASLDDPEDVGSEKALTLMYPDQGISRQITGTMGEVRKIGAEALRTFYADDFRTTAPLVTVAGGVDPAEIEEALLAQVSRERFSAQNSSLTRPEWRSGRYFPASDFSQAQVYLSYPLEVSRSPNDWHAWALINAIMGNAVSSRFFQSLREKNGLCYSVYSFYAFNRDSALWSAYVATPPEKTVEAVALLLLETESVVKFGFTDEEIRDAKTHLTGDLELSAEDTENRMKRLARQYLYGASVLTVDESIDLVRNIDPSLMHGLISSTFIKASESLVIYADKKTAKECSRKWR